jgi:2-haloacid dehalogenase
MATLNGVVFDAYGTLFDVHSIARRAEELFPQMGSAISTIWPDMLKVAAESSGLVSWLDHLISVDATRQYKTSPVCYALASETLQVPTESLLFVSSNAWDAMGATWYGFRTCWVNRQNLPPEALGLPPHHTCRTLEGLIEQF